MCHVRQQSDESLDPLFLHSVLSYLARMPPSLSSDLESFYAQALSRAQCQRLASDAQGTTRNRHIPEVRDEEPCKEEHESNESSEKELRRRNGEKEGELHGPPCVCETNIL